MLKKFGLLRADVRDEIRGLDGQFVGGGRHPVQKGKEIQNFMEAEMVDACDSPGINGFSNRNLKTLDPQKKKKSKSVPHRRQDSRFTEYDYPSSGEASSGQLPNFFLPQDIKNSNPPGPMKKKIDDLFKARGKRIPNLRVTAMLGGNASTNGNTGNWQKSDSAMRPSGSQFKQPSTTNRAAVRAKRTICLKGPNSILVPGGGDHHTPFKSSSRHNGSITNMGPARDSKGTENNNFPTEEASEVKGVNLKTLFDQAAITGSTKCKTVPIKVGGDRVVCNSDDSESSESSDSSETSESDPSSSQRGKDSILG